MPGGRGGSFRLFTEVGGGKEYSLFWLAVFTELQNRGVKDILFACMDGLTGLPEAIETRLG